MLPLIGGGGIFGGGGAPRAAITGNGSSPKMSRPLI
jgi:hypothetical protein